MKPLMADRELNKLNFLSHLKWKPNLVTLKQCYSYLEYYNYLLKILQSFFQRNENKEL